MIIKGTDIKIPDSLIVNGNLNGTSASELPEGLRVDGVIVGAPLPGNN